MVYSAKLGLVTSFEMHHEVMHDRLILFPGIVRKGHEEYQLHIVLNYSSLQNSS